jgi:hypothetical protein
MSANAVLRARTYRWNVGNEFYGGAMTNSDYPWEPHREAWISL